MSMGVIMRTLCCTSVVVLACLCSAAEEALLGQPASTSSFTDKERAQLDRERAVLEERLQLISGNDPLQADAGVFLKGIQWALRYETKPDPKDVALIQQALQRARQRMDGLAAGKP